MDNNQARSALLRGRGHWTDDLSFGSDSEAGARFTAIDVFGGRHALALNGVDALSLAGPPGLKACADNGGKRAGRPLALAALVDETRSAERDLHGAGMTGEIECRYHGRDFTVGEMALLRALIAAEPHADAGHALSRGVLPAHRLVQARRRPQGHDGPGHHAGHAQATA